MSRIEIRGKNTVLRDQKEYIAFGPDDYKRIIRGRDQCFLCGQRAKKNKEHVIPDWVIRLTGVDGERVRLPLGITHNLSTYRVPCCLSCNETMGDRLEVPISKIFKEGYSAVAARVSQRDPLLYAWLNFIYVKTHFKDNFLRVANPRNNRDRKSLGDRVDWDRIRNPHAIARSYIFDTEIMPSAIGSMVAIQVPYQQTGSSFGYQDGNELDCMYIRIKDIAIIASLHDLGAAQHYFREVGLITPEKISELDSLLLLAEFELASIRRFGYYSLDLEVGSESGKAILEGVNKGPSGMRQLPEYKRYSTYDYIVDGFFRNENDPTTVKSFLEIAYESRTLPWFSSGFRQPNEEFYFRDNWMDSIW